MYSVAEPRSEEPKLNCLLEPEPKLRIAAPAPTLSIYKGLKKFYRKKSWLLKKFCKLRYHNINPSWVQHARKKVLVLKSKKVPLVKVSYKSYSEPGGLKPEPAPK
jgi:hypothetical protein